MASGHSIRASQPDSMPLSPCHDAPQDYDAAAAPKQRWKPSLFREVSRVQFGLQAAAGQRRAKDAAGAAVKCCCLAARMAACPEDGCLPARLPGCSAWAAHDSRIVLSSSDGSRRRCLIHTETIAGSRLLLATPFQFRLFFSFRLFLRIIS